MKHSKSSPLSSSDFPREFVSQRWIAALEAARCLLLEIPSVQIQGLSLHPHGFEIVFESQGSFCPTWLPLVERHQSRLLPLKTVHAMMASNAAAWVKTQGQSLLAEQLMTLGRQEVQIVEWEDGQISWLPDHELGSEPYPPSSQGALIDLEAPCVWSLDSVDEMAMDGRKGWFQVSMVGLATESTDQLRRQQRAFKQFVQISSDCETANQDFLHGAAAQRVQELFASQVPTSRLVLPLTPLSRQEAVLQIASGWAEDNMTPASEERQVCQKAVGPWQEQEGALWGDLHWMVVDEVGAPGPSEWLQSVEQHLKLLGFESELVAHFNKPSHLSCGDVAFREGVVWISRWAQARGLSFVKSRGFDQSFCSERWGGPSLEWRIFDPMGASWPIARIAIGVESKAAWNRHWQRHFNRKTQRDAPRAEQKAALLKDGVWLMSSTSVDVEQEARLSEIWRAWGPRSRKSSKETDDRKRL